MLPLTIAVSLHLAGGLAGAPPRWPVLDKPAVLARQKWWDNRDWGWYEAKIPFFESPDPELDATYYYRWELVTKHLTYGSPATGYTFTEFIDRPFWSGAFGSISCPVGHQLDEVRWLKDRRIVEDFSRYWFETPGAQPRSYSNWYGAAVYGTYLVNADRRFLAAMLPHMEAQYDGWLKEHWDPTHRMFRWDGLHDGMEVNINSRLTTDEGAGADGYRPTLNSYLFADARAIADAATLLGDSAVAREYSARARDLKARVQQELWDSTRDFFFHQFAHDEKGGITAGSLTYRSGPYAGNGHGREEIGFVPWQFGLPDPGYASAWRFLMDTAYFAAPFGPTTVERHDPQFLISPRCCVWSGNAWPYATSQTLTAMANLLDDYTQDVVSPTDWFRLFRTYTLDQRKNGQPYIAEAANPDNGSWSGHDTYYHSEHYFHSSYVDLVITGLAGIRPRTDDTLEVKPLAPASWDYWALDDVGYHGHRISVLWDRTGDRYGWGAGLTLIADGKVIAHSTTPGRLAGFVGAPPAMKPPMRPSNLAVNNGHLAWPLVTTSYSAPGTSPSFLVDGNYWYHESPPNRWTTEGSPSRSDWVAVDFGTMRRINTMKLYLLADSSGVADPASYRLEMWQSGGWRPIPGQRRDPAVPTGHRANVVSFPTVATSRVRVVLTPKPGRSVGMTELEAWSPEATPLPPATAAPRNLAWGAVASASFTSRYDSVSEINDMVVAFTHYSRNRWTAYGTPSDSDWVALDFGAPRRVSRVELYLWGDGGNTRAPKRYTVQAWDGTAWQDVAVRSQVPVVPRTFSVNTVRMVPVTTSRLRVMLVHDQPAASGVTELMVFGDEQ